MDHSLPGSSIYGIFPAIYWSRLPCPSLGDPLTQGSNTCLLHISCIVDGFFFLFLLIYWRIIALQNFVFCQTSTRIGHRYTHIPSLLNLPPISLPTPRLTNNPCLSFQSQTSNYRRLSILHMVMEVSMLLSPYISPSPPLSPCPKVCSLCLFLHCCPANKFFSHFSRFHICALEYDIYLSLSDSLHSV